MDRDESNSESSSRVGSPCGHDRVDCSIDRADDDLFGIGIPSDSLMIVVIVGVHVFARRVYHT